MMIGFVHPGTSRGMFEMTIGSRKITPPRMLRIVPLGERYIRLRSNSSTRASSGVIVAHFTPTPYCLIALAASTVIWSSVASRDSMPRSKYFSSTSRYGRISWSLMNDQMMRVISSPSSSTTGFFTLILAMARAGYWTCAERSGPGEWHRALQERQPETERPARVQVDLGERRMGLRDPVDERALVGHDLALVPDPPVGRREPPMPGRDALTRDCSGVVDGDDAVVRQERQQPLEGRLVEREVVRRVEEDQVGGPAVDVLGGDRVLRARAIREAGVITEELRGAPLAIWVDVERVQPGVGVERAEEVERAAAAQEADLHDRLRPDHAHERVQQERLVTLNRTGHRVLEHRQVAEIGQDASACDRSHPPQPAAAVQPALEEGACLRGRPGTRTRRGGHGPKLARRTPCLKA